MSPHSVPTTALISATVLVVARDHARADELRECLGASGYRVSVILDGGQAVASFDPARTELVIADVDAPTVDGLALTLLLRRMSLCRDLPIIILVDKVTHGVAALDAGADDFVVRPCQPRELLARVRVHLRRRQRSRELLRRSLVDDLTGALNRGGIVDELKREMKRSFRSKLPVSILMVDVDGFKDINDSFGHGVGDRVLSELARRMATALRTSDRVGRYGGDEFLVVLPECGPEQGAAAVGRLRTAAVQVWRAVPVLDRALRVSVGVATAESGESVDALVRRADLAMYRDKRAAREASLAHVDGEGSPAPPALG